MSDINEKKTAVLHVRVPQTLRDRIDRIEEKHRVPMASQLVDAITALCDVVEREGRYAYPMRMSYGEAEESNRWQLNESAAGLLEQQVAGLAARVKTEVKKQAGQQNRGEKSIG